MWFLKMYICDVNATPWVNAFKNTPTWHRVWLVQLISQRTGLSSYLFTGGVVWCVKVHLNIAWPVLAPYLKNLKPISSGWEVKWSCVQMVSVDVLILEHILFLFYYCGMIFVIVVAINATYSMEWIHQSNENIPRAGTGTSMCSKIILVSG